MNTRKYAAEAIGTFWLTFGGCGSAVIASGFSASRHRTARPFVGLRPDCPHHGLRDWTHFRMSSQSGGHGRVEPPIHALPECPES
jgi:hypothetical protein